MKMALFQPYTSKKARIPCACQKLTWLFSNHHKSLPLPRKIDMLSIHGQIRTNITHQKTDKTSTSQKIKKRKNPSCLPAKIKMVLFQPSQNTAPATQNARAPIHWWPQVKMHFCRSENRKKAFRLHEMQISKVMPDHFGDGETQGLRVYLYKPI
jgi:hypothetical protein